MTEYLESIEISKYVKLTIKKGEQSFFYKGKVIVNNSEKKYIVVEDVKNIEIYCKYEFIENIEVYNE